MNPYTRPETAEAALYVAIALLVALPVAAAVIGAYLKAAALHIRKGLEAQATGQPHVEAPPPQPPRTAPNGQIIPEDPPERVRGDPEAEKLWWWAQEVMSEADVRTEEEVDEARVVLGLG